MVEQRVVLITGTSSGFGKACAEHLHRRGYRVFGTSRRATPGRAPAADGGMSMGFETLAMDVTDDESVLCAVETVVREAGRIDVVVNNAGMGIAGAVEDTTDDEARVQMETNFFGVLRVCRAVLPQMREQGRGLIINISSIGGHVGVPFQAMYSASKFAVEGLSEALRMEVRPFGIHVVLIEPGDACTGFTSHRRRTVGSQRNPTYKQYCENALAVMEADERNGFAPERLARLVERVIQARSPRLRYVVAPVHEAAVLALKPFLPARLFEWGVRAYYRLR